MRLIASILVLAACAHAPPPPRATRDREVESLEQAVRWPNATAPVVMQLANAWLSTGRSADGYAYFNSLPHERPLFEALTGVFQARMADSVPLLSRIAWVDDAIAKLDHAAASDGLSRYLRGVVFVALPDRFGKKAQGADDLKWVIEQGAQFPPGLRRSAADALEGRAGSASDFAVSARDGFRFSPPEVREPAKGVYVARGYDFADLAFVSTSEGLVAIDAGTTPATAAAALAAVRAKLDSADRAGAKPESADIAKRVRMVIVTHSHWDHIGGLSAFAGAEVISRSNYRGELARVNASGQPFKFFFGESALSSYTLDPQRTIEKPDTARIVVGGRRFELIPTEGGETDDALMIRLPDEQITFVGDAFMPYFGAPFVAEGSVDGALATIAQLRALGPSTLIHGHAALTDNFTFAVLEPLGAALTEVRDAALKGLHDGRTLASILDDNLLPESLRDHPDAVLPFLLMRDDAIQRIHAQRTGYWKSDGEGMTVFSDADWGRALELVGAEGLARAAAELNGRGDYAMALRLSTMGLAAHTSEPLAAERRKALDGLRAQYQFNPFKLIIYTELAARYSSPSPDPASTNDAAPSSTRHTLR